MRKIKIERNMNDRKVRVRVETLRQWKNKAEPFVCLTAYTTPMARIIDPHVDLILVGDSVGMVLYGMESTLGVTPEMMIAHGKAVMRPNPGACVIVDMPYGTTDSKSSAYDTARRIMDETGCDGVKIEGGQEKAGIIAHLVQKGIPVMGHIGLMPQSVEQDGGYKVKGKTLADRERLIADARALEKAGAFSFVLEGTIADTAEAVSAAVNIPSVGIGASPACDGQILVSEDLLGLSLGKPPKFVRLYAQLASDINKAVEIFADDVRRRNFPGPQELYNGQNKGRKSGNGAS